MLLEVVKAQHLEVESKRAIGGARFDRMAYTVRAPSPRDGAKFYALLWDCGTDSRVTSDVRDQYQKLVASGYTTILALRDVRPDFSLSDIPRLRSTFEGIVPKHPVQPRLFFAAQEIEAWFLAEYSHFVRIDAGLTPSRIKQAFGTDLRTQTIENIAHPAALLKDIYGLAGLSYTKSAGDALRTVTALDFKWLRGHLPSRAPNFAPLLSAVVEFFSPRWRIRLRRLVGR